MFDFQINISDIVVFVVTFRSGQVTESLAEEFDILGKHAYFLSIPMILNLCLCLCLFVFVFTSCIVFIFLTTVFHIFGFLSLPWRCFQSDTGNQISVQYQTQG